MKFLSRLTLLVLAALLATTPAEAKKVKIKLATLAPDGSTWDELLKDLASDWSRISDGQVQLRIYAGGVAGDEPQVMKKMGINNYHAALVTSHGLSTISRSTLVFTIPRMLRTNEELDKAMEIMGPTLAKRLEEKGYIVLAWADAGWVKFFVPTPDISVDDIRKVKLMSWAGDSEGLELWRAAGFNVVPLPATELLTGLQTKLVNAFDTMPYYALASQAFRHTPYMIDMKWAPLPGALIITKAKWDQIPDDLKPALREAAHKWEIRFRKETRQMDAEAVDAMKERGLTVLEPTQAQVAGWDKAVKAAYPDIRGFYVSDEDFDWLQKIVKEIRGENP